MSSLDDELSDNYASLSNHDNDNKSKKDKHKNRKQKRDSDSNNEEEEDDDGTENNDYEQDSFVVSDDDADVVDSDVKEKKKKKKKLKKRVHEESFDELDEDDLDLIEENKQQGGEKQFQRLKKKQKQIDSSDDELDLKPQRRKFDVDELDSDEIEDDIIKSPKKKKRSQFDDFSDEEEELLGQEDDMEEEENEEQLEKDAELVRRQFQDGLTSDGVISSEQATIRDRDIPERLQIRFKNRENPRPNELLHESDWIYQKMKNKAFKDSNIMKDRYVNKIKKVLELIRVEYMEIMYIWFYKKMDVLEELNLDNLWEIYELDLEWEKFKNLKDSCDQKYSEVSQLIDFDSQIQKSLEKSDDVEKQKQIENYLNFVLYYQGKTNQKVEKSWQFYKKMYERGLNQVIRNFFLTPEQLADNISKERNQLHKPPVDQYAPSYVIGHLQQKHPDIFNQDAVNGGLKILKYIAQFGAIELANYPIIRTFGYYQYKYRIRISTFPTEKGEKELDILHPLFIAKRLKKFPIKDLLFEGDRDRRNRDELNYVLLEKAEKLGLIKIKFHFQWEDPNNEKELDKENDEIYKQILGVYTSQDKEDKFQKDWDIMRQETISNLLGKYLYPKYKQQLKEELREFGQNQIIKNCSQKFYKQLKTGPHKANVNQANKDKGKESVMSVVLTPNNHLVIVFVDKYGVEINKLTLKYYYQKQSPEHFSELENLEKNYIKQIKPLLIVVAANDIKSTKIKEEMIEYRESKYKYTDWVTYGDDTIPQMIARRNKNNNINSDSNQEYVEIALSLARYMQNPLSEILNLWSEDIRKNGCLLIPYHPLQDQVKLSKLKAEYEKQAVQAVNEVGIDINILVGFNHYQNQLQFISGLGPIKAQSLIQKINTKSGNSKIRSRKQMFFKEEKGEALMEATVFQNCNGFLKIEGDHPLDRTRIQYSDYSITQKICNDAQEEEEEEEQAGYKKKKEKKSSIYYTIEYTMANPQILKDLDYEGYAKHLAQVKKKENMIHLLNFIKTQLTIPFEDPRESYKEMSDDKLFYKLSKESPQSFKKWTVVSCQVNKILSENKMTVKISDNGLVGIVFQSRSSNKNLEQINFEKIFKRGDIIKCVVDKIHALEPHGMDERKEKISKNNLLTVNLTTYTRPDQFPNWAKATEELHPIIKDIANYIEIRPENDYPKLLNKVKQQTGRTVLRKINHPKYKQSNYSTAVEYLKDKENGEFVIRSSSQGPEYLTITWKFLDDCIVNLQIIQENSISQVAPIFKMNGQEFESLDEIIVSYIEPINSIMENIPQHHKFMKGSQNELENKLKDMKRNDPNTIHYLIGNFKHTQQYLVLLYCVREEFVTKEYIKVKPFGLLFHNNYYSNLNHLISWFKQNFQTEEYRKYIRKYKNPFQDQEDKNQKQSIHIKQEMPGIKREKSEFKSEYQKRSIICTRCKQPGHAANNCTNQGPSYYDNSYGHRNNRSRSRDRYH